MKFQHEISRRDCPLPTAHSKAVILEMGRCRQSREEEDEENGRRGATNNGLSPCHSPQKNSSVLKDVQPARNWLIINTRKIAGWRMSFLRDRTMP